MNYGISLLNIPVRKSPKEQSEMITQLLFGETFDILEETKKWCRIKFHFDSEIGWIDKKVCHYISNELFNQIQTSEKLIISNQVSIQNNNNLYPQTILPGSTLPNISHDYSCFSLEKNQFTLLSKPETIDKNSNITQSMVKVALSFVNAPYLWGGRSLYGIDCSGYTQIIYKICGTYIPRNSYQQANIGKPVENIKDTHSGDLVFFDNKNGDITHVGMMLDKKHIIHASGKVRIDKIDEQGIFNEEKQTYTHKFRSIQTII